MKNRMGKRKQLLKENVALKKSNGRLKRYKQKREHSDNLRANEMGASLEMCMANLDNSTIGIFPDYSGGAIDRDSDSDFDNMEAVAETETSTTLAKTSSLMNPKGKGKGRRHQIGVKNAAIRLMAECECSTSNAVRGISIVLEGMCGEKVDEKDFADPTTVGRWRLTA